MGFRNWKLYLLILITAILDGNLYPQFKSISGLIGSEYRKQDYFYSNSNSLYSRFSQLIELQTNGYIYNVNMVEFNLHSQFMNANSSTHNPSSSAKLKENYFGFYDLNLDALRRSNFPVIIFLKNDLNINSVEAPFESTISNQVFTNSKGLILSPKLNSTSNSKVSLFTFRYNDTKTHASNPKIPLNQTNRDFQVSFDLPQFLSTQADVELIHRSREDNIRNVKYLTNEAHLRGTTQASAVDQISFNANYWKESSFSSIMASTFWNSQRFQDMVNQLNCQFRVTNTGMNSIFDGSVNEQLNINISQNLSGNIITSHQETYSNSRLSKTTFRNSVLSGGVNYQGNSGKFLMNVISHVSYQRNQSLFLRQSVEGFLAAGLQTQGFSFGNISLSDQISVRKYLARESFVFFQNTVSSSIESNITGELFLRANGNFSVSGIADSSNNIDKNYALLTSLIYRSFKVIPFYLSFNYSRDWYSNSFQVYSISRYSATLQLPNLYQNFTVQGRITKTFNVFQNNSEFNYDVIAVYALRALNFSMRITGYSIAKTKRKDLFFTLSRPFSVNFE